MALAQTTSYPKHDIHKFRDIKPKLNRDNWYTWKRELLAVARMRGLHDVIISTDKEPTNASPGVTTVTGTTQIAGTPLSELLAEWNDRNDTADNSDADPDLYKDDPQHASLHLDHHLITQPTLVPCHTRSSDSSTPSNIDPRVHPYETT